MVISDVLRGWNGSFFTPKIVATNVAPCSLLDASHFTETHLSDLNSKKYNGRILRKIDVLLSPGSSTRFRKCLLWNDRMTEFLSYLLGKHLNN